MRIPLDRNSFVTSITLPFLRKFGSEALEWDPLIVRDAFETGFDYPKMPQRMFDKLNCGLSLIGTSLYTDSIEGFLTNTAVMNNLVLDGDTVPYVTLEQCAWGIWEYINLNGDIDEHAQPTEKFCPDIVKYIQSAGAMNGMTSMPRWMKFAESDQNPLPDMSDDVDLFESYMARQDGYMAQIEAYVTEQQEKLKQELAKLADAGFVG